MQIQYYKYEIEVDFNMQYENLLQKKVIII